MNFNEVGVSIKRDFASEWDGYEEEEEKKSMCFIKCILFLFMYGEVCFRPQANSKHVFL